MIRTLAIGTAAAALMLTGCARGPALGIPVAGGQTASAAMRTANGGDAGRATATGVAGGVRFTLDAHDLPPGLHGVHVHMTGACDAPGFVSAGGHWNPTGAEHGAMNPQGPHEGDLPNLIVGSDGRGTVAVTVPGATMAALMDQDGAAMIVHAMPDDLKTDPSGNSGARIACGVFRLE